jgi:hypothetical protein
MLIVYLDRAWSPGERYPLSILRAPVINHMPIFIIAQDAAFEVTVEFPLYARYRLLTPRKSPHRLPGGGSSISCDHGSNDWP